MRFSFPAREIGWNWDKGLVVGSWRGVGLSGGLQVNEMGKVVRMVDQKGDLPEMPGPWSILKNLRELFHKSTFCQP